MTYTGAITFDFHNTLIHCDPWFELEVRSLPSAFLRARASGLNGAAHLDRAAAADRAYRSLRSAIVEHGHEMSAERCLALVLDRVGVTATDDETATTVARLMAEALPQATPVAGAVETVTELANAGVPLGVVSSAVYHPFLEWALDRFAMRPLVRVVTTSASAGYYKSRPEIYWTALDALGNPPERSLHVGDSYRYDVLGAKRAGMRAALLSADAAGPEADLRLPTLHGAAPTLLHALERLST